MEVLRFISRSSLEAHVHVGNSFVRFVGILLYMLRIHANNFRLYSFILATYVVGM